MKRRLVIGLFALLPGVVLGQEPFKVEAWRVAVQKPNEAKTWGVFVRVWNAPETIRAFEVEVSWRADWPYGDGKIITRQFLLARDMNGQAGLQVETGHWPSWLEVKVWGLVKGGESVEVVSKR